MSDPALVDALDRLDVPLTVSSREARAALKEHGVKARGTTLGAAIRYRREAAEKRFPNAGNIHNGISITDDGKQRETDGETLGKQWEAVGGASGKPFPTLRWETGFPAGWKRRHQAEDVR